MEEIKFIEHPIGEEFQLKGPDGRIHDVVFVKSDRSDDCTKRCCVPDLGVECDFIQCGAMYRKDKTETYLKQTK